MDGMDGMDGRAGRGPIKGPIKRTDGGHSSPIVVWALGVALAGGLLGATGASAGPRASAHGGGRPPAVVRAARAEETRGAGGTIDFRRAPEPTAQERETMRRWHTIWREETGPLRNALGRLGAAEHPSPVADRQWCSALGAAVLGVDQARVFPAPSYAVGVRLRRALGSLVRAANACFERRPYEASFRLAQAHEAFAQAGRLLRPYGVAP